MTEASMFNSNVAMRGVPRPGLMGASWVKSDSSATRTLTVRQVHGISGSINKHWSVDRPLSATIRAQAVGRGDPLRAKSVEPWEDLNLQSMHCYQHAPHRDMHGMHGVVEQGRGDQHMPDQAHDVCQGQYHPRARVNFQPEEVFYGHDQHQNQNRNQQQHHDIQRASVHNYAGHGQTIENFPRKLQHHDKKEISSHSAVAQENTANFFRKADGQSDSQMAHEKDQTLGNLPRKGDSPTGSPEPPQPGYVRSPSVHISSVHMCVS